MRTPRWAWALPSGAFVAVVAAIVAVMSHAEPRLAGTNNVRLAGFPITVGPGDRFCQTGEQVPARTAHLQLTVGTEGRAGPPLALSVGDEAVRVQGGYGDFAKVLADVPAGTSGPATVCVRNAGRSRIFLGGQDASQQLPLGLAGRLDGKPVLALAQILYWREGSETGWEVAGAAFDRWGLVTALDALTPWLALLAFAGACIGAVALAARGRAGPLACGVVAVAAAAGWALTTPAFHVPDEPQHVAYAQYLAETGDLPRPVPGAVFSPEEDALFRAVAFNNVAGNDRGRPPWITAQDAELDRQLAAEPGRLSEGALTNTTNHPPLFYGLEAAALGVTSSGDFLDRLLAMRIVAALLAGLTAAFSFLFVRELLPTTPWAWPAGALALAVQPLLGFIGGGVNNDAGLFAVGAALLWLVARAFRRGLDRATAIGVGAALGLGLVVKATTVALTPGLLAVLAVLLLRADPGGRARVLRLAAVAAAIAAVPAVCYVVLNQVLWDRPLWNEGVPGSSPAPAGRVPQLTEFAGYLWQFYLPRLPFMVDQHEGIPLFNVWFKGFIGRYGWLDTTFPNWVYDVALAIYVCVGALAVRGLWLGRRALASGWGEVLAYAVLVAGFVAVVGWAGYTGRLANGFVFEQTRYLLPLGALYAGLVALAVRGAGARLGRPVGAALVVLACGHTLLSALLVAGRFYV